MPMTRAALTRALDLQDEDRQQEILRLMYPQPRVLAQPGLDRAASLDLPASFALLRRRDLTALCADNFSAAEALGKRPLSALACFLLHQQGVVDALALNVRKMEAFFRVVEDGYGNNPYHGRVHALDVLQRVHAIMAPTRQAPEMLLAVYTAAAAHDFGHTGLTNSYLVATGHILAERYHGRSPMENFHVFCTLQLLRQPATAFMPAALLEGVSQTVVDLVLATDIACHVRCMRPPPTPAEQEVWRLKVCLKSADVGHTATPRLVHQRWVAALLEELGAQQKLEEAAGLPLTLPAVRATQADFFDFIVLPMLDVLAGIWPHTAPLAAAARSNRALYDGAIPGPDGRPVPVSDGGPSPVSDGRPSTSA